MISTRIRSRDRVIEAPTQGSTPRRRTPAAPPGARCASSRILPVAGDIGSAETARRVVDEGDARPGSGYGHVTREAFDAIRFLAAHEGLLLDPVYSAKAFAGLLSQARRGEFGREDNILFVMTGG